jgi:hypothetical protein
VIHSSLSGKNRSLNQTGSGAYVAAAGTPVVLPASSVPAAVSAAAQSAGAAGVTLINLS